MNHQTPRLYSSDQSAHAPHIRHGWMTRVAHAALALTVVAQLLLSLVMSGPRPDQPLGTLLLLHSYVGLAALLFSFAFWGIVMFRRTGTEIGKIMPWFSARRRRNLAEDVRRHLQAIRARKLPAYDETAALPSAVHGLGLLLMLVMALLGAVWFFAGFADMQNTPVVKLAVDMHKFFANLVWVYLIAHAALALIHHYLDELSLSEMWSLGASPPNQNREYSK